MPLCNKFIPCTVSLGQEGLWSPAEEHMLAEVPGTLVLAAGNEALPPLWRRPDQSQGEKRQRLHIFVEVG